MRGFPSGAVVKNLSANAGDTRDTQFDGGDPLEDDMAPHSSILAENPMDRGAWQATVHGVAKSQTRLSYTEHKHLKFHSCCSV